MFLCETIKKIDLNRVKEPLLLFMLFFFPGYLSQSQIMDGSIFNSAWFNVMYLIMVIPQIMLLLYLIEKKSSALKPLYGLDKLSKKDVAYGLLYFTGILGLILITGLISTFTSTFIYDSARDIPMWHLDNYKLIPLIFITCLATGYSEEFFFRSYLLTEFHSPGKERYLIAGTSLIFALGHIYQGFQGFLGTLAIGIFLSIIFLKKRRLHSIAIAHGLYNFTVLMISLFINI